MGKIGKDGLLVQNKDGSIFGIYFEDGTIKIKAVSLFRERGTNSLRNEEVNKRLYLINNKIVKDNHLIEDYTFSSPSFAISVLTGIHESGNRLFFTVNNISLGDYLNSENNINVKRHLIEEDDEYGVIDSFDIDINDTYVPEFKPVEIVKAKYEEKEKIVRNVKRAKGSIIRSDYKCNIDENHKSFVSKNGKPYMEAHHLIPLGAQDKFKYGLDADANIVCLCPNCHRNLHYGKDIDEILKKLYDSREQELEESGIHISYEELLILYE